MMGYANTKFKTEKRKANVGERILITSAYCPMGFYRNGDVLTVDSYYNGISRGIKAKETKADCPFIRHDEYEVIIADKPSKNERISLLESQVAELQAKVEALEKVKKPKYTLTELLSKMPTPNQQRKAVIDRAKEFVADVDIPKSQRLNFYVNADKRTVVAVITWARTGFVKQREYAKCAPDDVFNADIGKAIALGRALGLDVSEFENAVKPTEVVVGTRILYHGIEEYTEVFTVIAINHDNFSVNTGEFLWNYRVTDGTCEIIDDTNAEYV